MPKYKWVCKCGWPYFSNNYQRAYAFTDGFRCTGCGDPLGQFGEEDAVTIYKPRTRWELLWWLGSKWKPAERKTK